MGETTTIAEVEDVTIKDDGYDDEYVRLYVDGNRENCGFLSDIESKTDMFSDKVTDAIEKAREWYDNGRSHTNGPYLYGESHDTSHEEHWGFKIPLSALDEDTFAIRESGGEKTGDWTVAWDSSIDVSDLRNDGKTWDRDGPRDASAVIEVLEVRDE